MCEFNLHSDVPLSNAAIAEPVSVYLLENNSNSIRDACCSFRWKALV